MNNKFMAVFFELGAQVFGHGYSYHFKLASYKLIFNDPQIGNVISIFYAALFLRIRNFCLIQHSSHKHLPGT